MPRKIQIPETENEWFDVTDPTQFVRTYNALRRREQRKAAMRGEANTCGNSVQISLGHGHSCDGYWFDMNNKQTEELLFKHANAKPHSFANCVSTPIVRFKTGPWDICVWPMHKADFTLNKDNNWGRDE